MIKSFTVSIQDILGEWHHSDVQTREDYDKSLEENLGKLAASERFRAKALTFDDAFQKLENSIADFSSRTFTLTINNENVYFNTSHIIKIIVRKETE